MISSLNGGKILVLNIYDNLRKLFSIFYFVLIKITNSNAKFVGCDWLMKGYKNSDTLFGLASGSSINNYTDCDFIHIQSHDSIAVSFFLIHEFVPTFYLTETHPTEVGWFGLLRYKNKYISQVPVIYKGYNSPKNLTNIIKNSLAMPKTSKNFFIMKDSALRGEFDDIPNEFLYRALDGSKSDYFYNYIASIIYIVFMSYKMGYKNVVLCGFDMDDKYFYCTNEKYKSEANALKLCEEQAINKIAKDPWRKKNIIEVLIFMNEKFKLDRNGGVYVYSEKMSLSEYLPVYKYR